MKKPKTIKPIKTKKGIKIIDPTGTRYQYPSLKKNIGDLRGEPPIRQTPAKEPRIYNVCVVLTQTEAEAVIKLISESDNPSCPMGAFLREAALEHLGSPDNPMQKAIQ